jgi:2-polyprenyl-3-methyl-5-hydroxy-6-metoxy-1,4-benzoquinol methylase
VPHPQIEVRIQDLSNEANIKPEFDLVTCLSTIEHVGLGRYGDRLDPWGDIKLAHNIRKLTRPGGIVLMSFPVGTGCVVYNTHRIYSAYRRALLFEGYTVLGVYRGQSLYRRARHALGNVIRGPLGRFTQPIYVLRQG